MISSLIALLILTGIRMKKTRWPLGHGLGVRAGLPKHSRILISLLGTLFGGLMQKKRGSCGYNRGSGSRCPSVLRYVRELRSSHPRLTWHPPVTRGVHRNNLPQGPRHELNLSLKVLRTLEEEGLKCSCRSMGEPWGFLLIALSIPLLLG